MGNQEVAYMTKRPAARKSPRTKAPQTKAAAPKRGGPKQNRKRTDHPPGGPAAIFAALGDPTRLALIGKLGDGEAYSITRLSTGTAMTRQAVTKHLQVLEKIGLVRHARLGRESHFALRPRPIAEAQIYLEDIAQQWDAALARLKAMAEKA
jgi:DNA-binding transcriptional ArsR family regulator